MPSTFKVVVAHLGVLGVCREDPVWSFEGTRICAGAIAQRCKRSGVSDECESANRSKRTISKREDRYVRKKRRKKSERAGGKVGREGERESIYEVYQVLL